VAAVWAAAPRLVALTMSEGYHQALNVKQPAAKGTALRSGRAQAARGGGNWGDLRATRSPLAGLATEITPTCSLQYLAVSKSE
jgi:hypothetical protein